jgi:hypothetical protein
MASARCRSCLGHKDVQTTMVNTHVLNRGGRGVLSPADRLRQPAPGMQSVSILLAREPGWRQIPRRYK